MKRDSSKKKRRVRALVLLSFIALFFFLSTGKRGFIQHFRVRYQRAQLKKQIESLRETKTQMEEEKKKLDNPDEIERLAREKYGMARKNEKVYRVVPKEKK